MAPPKDPIELVIRNAITLQRVHNAIARDTTGIIRQLFDEIVAELVKIDPTSVGPVRYRRDRVQKLIDRVQSLSRVAMRDVHRTLRADLAALGQHQGAAAAELLRVSLGPFTGRINPGPTVNMMRTILDTNPFRGETLKGWADVQQQGVVRRVRQQIQLGMAGEETISDLVRRIRGTATGAPIRDTRGRITGYRFTGGVLETTTREATALVRTAVTDIANTAAHRTYSANSRATKTYTYVATLDARTTLICMALDGQVFAYDTPVSKRPPQHWQCRSIIVPNVDWEALGLKPPEEGTRAARDPVTGKSIQVPASDTYDDWLRRAPPQLQNEILGPGRAELFRSGKVSLRDLVKSDNGIVPLSSLVASPPAGPPGALPALPGGGGTGGAHPVRAPALVSALDDVEQRIKTLPVEEAYAFDLTGSEVLRKTQGHASQVSFSQADLQLIPNAVLTHNHPRSSSFSPADVVFAIDVDLDEIRAVGRAFRYRLIRPQTGWSSDLSRRIIKALPAVEADVMTKFTAAIASGAMTQAQAELLHYHEVWTRLAQKFSLDYRQEGW